MDVLQPAPVARALVVSGAVLVLALVAVEDARAYRIRNAYVLALVALYAASATLDGATLDGATWRPAWHAAFALAALALLFGAFALGLIGAGDAKLLSAGCLWVGPEGAVPFSLGLALLGGLYGLAAVRGWLPARREGGRTRIPLGPSVAGAWIGALLLEGVR